MPNINIKLYHTSSNPNVLSKYLTSEKTKVCQITSECDIQSPVFLFDFDGSIVSGYNFAFVPEWGKYYFINEPNVLNGNQLEISGKIDPLMSNRSAILNSQIIAGRSSSNYENYIEDNMIRDSGKIRTVIRRLPKVFDTANATNNYLIILGGR